MSGLAEQVTASAGASPATRVRRASLAVPAAAVVAGGASVAVDLRGGFLASAVVIGWTQLVGL